MANFLLENERYFILLSLFKLHDKEQSRILKNRQLRNLRPLRGTTLKFL
jgi:hypothetical protein